MGTSATRRREIGPFQQFPQLFRVIIPPLVFLLFCAVAEVPVLGLFWLQPRLEPEHMACLQGEDIPEKGVGRDHAGEVHQLIHSFQV